MQQQGNEATSFDSVGHQTITVNCTCSATVYAPPINGIVPNHAPAPPHGIMPEAPNHAPAPPHSIMPEVLNHAPPPPHGIMPEAPK